MTTSTRDRTLLRDLAHRVADVATLPEQAEKTRLWTACNDLHPERPMVFADPQNGWGEIDAAWVQLECQNSELRGWEHALRRRLVRHEQIHDDYPILATFPIPIPVTGNSYDDYGLELAVTRSDQTDGAYHIEPAIRTEADLEHLHFRPLQLDHAAADRATDRAHHLFGDILQVYKTGRTSWRYGLTRVLVHMRGLDRLFLDMYDAPDLLHRLLAFLRDDFMREIDLFEQQEAIGLNNTPDHVTGSGGLSPTRALPGETLDGPPGARHCVCWAESQETGVVGPDQFDEFVLQYQLPLLQRFGLIDYGCCEPLDRKYDLLMQKIPNLCWLAVQRWADRPLAAEKIGPDYVYVYKPNPTPICTPTPDWDDAEKDIRDTLEVARNCPLHIVMKDTHTFCNQPERITRWTDLASRLAQDAA
jgi:hypothetical protein